MFTVVALEYDIYVVEPSLTEKSMSLFPPDVTETWIFNESLAFRYVVCVMVEGGTTNDWSIITEDFGT